MKTTSLSFVENKESRVSSMNQEVIDTTSMAVRSYKVGNIYRYANHTFAIWAKGAWKNETTGKVSNHVVFAVTFDGGTQEYYLDSEGIKQKIGDERRAARAVSMDGNGKAMKVKRTSKETAELVEAKYNKAISSLEDIIAKLNCSEEAKAQATELVCVLIKDKYSKVEAINNEAKAKQAERLNRIEELYKTLPDVQGKAVSAMGNGDFELAAELAKQAKDLKAELDALQAEEAAYIASIASEATETETTAEETAE